MPDKIKEILEKVLAWWNKFTTKQKTIIIGVTAVVIFTFAMLISVFTKPVATARATVAACSDVNLS